FLLSPRLSCKELLIAGNVAGSFGGARVASVEDIVRGAAPLGLASARQDAVDGADVIVTIGTGVLNYNPVLGFRVKRAAKAGAKLVHIGMASPDMKKYAKTIIPAGKTGEAGVLSALCGVIVQKGLCDRGKISMLKEGVTFLKTRFEEAGGVTGAALEQLAAELCDHSKKVVFIINEDQMLTARPDLKWAHDTLMLAGRSDSLIVVRNESNSRGMQDVVYGMLGHGPEVAKTAEAVKSGAIRAVVSIGQDPSALKGLEGVEFSVAVDMFETAFSQSADVVVPLSAIFESLGASISFDGRMVRYEPAMAPAHGFDNTAFLGAMLSATGAKVPTHEELRDSFVAANPAYSEFMKTGALLSYSDAGWRPGRFLCEKAAAVDAGSVYRSATTWSKVWEKKVR
ncbi:MAG: molybdopterin-dependent oxidoreductase, partial [Myxococcota bacterium]